MQGASLVDNALQTGEMFKSESWKYIMVGRRFLIFLRHQIQHPECLLIESHLLDKSLIPKHGDDNLF